MAFRTKKQPAEGSHDKRKKEVDRAVLLIKRATGSPPTDATKKVGLWKLERAIPDDIRREALDILGSDDSARGLAEKVGRPEDPVKDTDFDRSTSVAKADTQPALEDTVSLLREFTSQANVIESMVADLKADGVEVTEEEVREYLAGVDFDAIVKQVGEAPA